MAAVGLVAPPAVTAPAASSGATPAAVGGVGDGEEGKSAIGCSGEWRPARRDIDIRDVDALLTDGSQ